MKRNLAIIFGLSLALIMGQAARAGQTPPPGFYLATDRSFHGQEMPYINLEGPGDREYQLRIYRVDDPAEFFKKSVQARRVGTVDSGATARPLAVAGRTWQLLRTDLRRVSQQELNPATRGTLRSWLGIDYNKRRVPQALALPARDPGRTLYREFTLPAVENSWRYRRVPLPIAEKGVYIVEAVGGASVARTLVIKSDLSCVIKQASKQTLVYAAHAVTGVPVAGAGITFYDGAPGSGTPRTAKTGSAGTYLFEQPTASNSLVIVTSGGEFAVSDPNYYATSFFGEGGMRTYLYTERPVYRPGDEVCFKGIVRRYSDGNYSPVAGKGIVEVYDTDGNTMRTGIAVDISQNNGTFNGSFVLPGGDSVKLGTWTCVLRYEGEAFSTEFGVDAYRKPPFLVKVALSEPQYLKGQKARVNVNARYYYGTPLAGCSVRCQVIRRARYDYSPVGMLPFFVDARAYLGRDGSNVRRETVMEKNGKLDDDGNYSFEIPLGDDITDDYTYSVIALVADREAGLSGSAAFQVARSRFYLRSQAARAVYEPGARAEFEVQLVPYMNSAAGDIAGREVKATLYSRDFVHISREDQARPLKTETLRTDANGRARVSFVPPDSGHYSVLFEAVDSGGQKTSLATAFWIAGRADNIALPFKNINLVTDRDIYSVGDTAAIMLACPVPGRPVLLTVEGEKLYSHEVLRPQGNTLMYNIKITPELSPNFTVAAVQFADGNIYRNEIKVVAPPHEKFIGVQLTPAKKEYRPGETAEIAIETKTAGNKPVQAEVSLAVVDEAIYQIREDANPQIGTFFYHPRRNDISTAFSAAYRFFGYAEERRLQLALERGSNPALAAIKEDDKRSRERFKDTTAWVAKVMTDANGRAVVRVPLADNITTWRVTAVAVTPDTRVGQGRVEFVARKPLMLRAGLPQYILGGEKQTIALTAQNMTASRLEAKLEVSAEGVDVVEGAARMIVLAPGESVQVYSTLQAGPKAAQAVVKATLTAGDLRDSEARTLPVRAPGIAGNAASALTLRGNSTGALTLELPPRFERPNLNLRVSPGYSLAVRQSLDYLVGYPWGCIEQTMSRFMPVLAAAKAGMVPEDMKRELPAMVDRGLALIRQNQRGDGGFGWFGENTSDPMMTAWVLRGLVICQKLGYDVDRRVLARTSAWLFVWIGRNNPEPFVRAWVLDALSYVKPLDQGMLDRCVQDSSRSTGYARALTARALLNSGKTDVARNMYNTLLAQSAARRGVPAPSGRGADWASDPVEEAAVLLEIGLRLNAEAPALEELAVYMLGQRRGPAWNNSRDTAMAVLALSEYQARFRDRNQQLTLAWAVNGSRWTTEQRVSNEDNGLIKPDVSLLRAGRNEINVRVAARDTVFLSADAGYYDLSPRFDAINLDGASISRSFYRFAAQTEGNNRGFVATPVLGFNAGDLIMVELSLSGFDGRYYMLEDHLPPGFSLERNDREFYSARYPKEYASKSGLDDRTVFFLPGLSSEEQTVVRYFIRANLPGSYRWLPAQNGSMYYTTARARSGEQRVTVEAK